jgi:hypothetical protein
MADCPTAAAIHELLASPVDPAQLQALGAFGSVDELRVSLKEIGIDLESCDPEQTLRVIRQVLGNLSDDDLFQAQGGEVKFAVTAVALGSAAAVAGGIAVAGVAAGGAILSTQF